MNVISVNIGLPQTVLWRGKSIITGIYKKPVAHPIYLDYTDVKDDSVIDRRYHGGFDKACYLYSANAYEYWRKLYPNVDLNWGALGENITINGLNENSIYIGDIYTIGDAIIEIAQPRQPCFKQGIRFGTQRIVKDFINSSYSGIYVRVIKPGFVYKEDAMTLLNPSASKITVAQVHSLMSSNKTDSSLAQKALNTQKLALSYRKDIAKWFNIPLN